MVTVTLTITTDAIKAVMEPDMETEITINSGANMRSKDEVNQAINLYTDSARYLETVHKDKIPSYAPFRK